MSMNVNSKLCPLCGSDPVTTYLGVYCSGQQNTKCILRRDPIEQKDWNNRPLEDKLKKAIDILLGAIIFSRDKNLARHIITSRMKEACEDVRSF